MKASCREPVAGAKCLWRRPEGVYWSRGPRIVRIKFKLNWLGLVLAVGPMVVSGWIAVHLAHDAMQDKVLVESLDLKYTSFRRISPLSGIF